MGRRFSATCCWHCRDTGNVCSKIAALAGRLHFWRTSPAFSCFGTAYFASACPDCPLRAQCTTAASGRTVSVGPYEQTLTDARARQTDPAWTADYRATRPKVERKLGHLVRRHHGGRRARVRGTVRVDADFRLLAGAVNLARLAMLGLRGTTQGWAVAA